MPARPVVNTHVHIAPNYSAFSDVGDALAAAAAEGAAAVGISNFFDQSVYPRFGQAAEQAGITPLYGLEFITLVDELAAAGIRVNDPANPGRMYLCGKGIDPDCELSERADATARAIRQGNDTRMAEMTEKLSAHLVASGLPEGFTAADVAAKVAQAGGVPVEWVSLQERHLAQAAADAVLSQGAEQATAILTAAYGQAPRADLANPAAVQAEVRSRLLKVGTPAFAPESPLSMTDAYLHVLDRGGIPTYPTLADGVQPVCEFEADPAELASKLLELGIHAAELIPIRNASAEVDRYVQAFTDAGLIVVAGTEHNTPDRIPIAPACVDGPLSNTALAAFWEGTCIVAAHQARIKAGRPGYVDADGAPTGLRAELFAEGERIIAPDWVAEREALIGAIAPAIRAPADLYPQEGIMLIAHDLGTSSNKASLFDVDGRLVGSATASYSTRFASGGVAEQYPDDWWAAVVSSTRELLTTTGIDPARVLGICTAGQMMAAVCLDATGRPVRPAPIWSDQRATAQAAALACDLGPGELYRITGHRVSAGYTLPKLAWIRDHDPAAFAETRQVCVTKDYVNLRLSGVLAIDHSDASSTGAYDLAAERWSAPVIEAAGLDERVFPQIVASTQVLGTLTPRAAAELGLPAGVQVIAGGGDGPMASVAAGCLAPADDGYVSLGTSAWYSTTTSAPLLDAAQRGFTFRHVVPGVFAPCATTQSGAASLGWLAESFGTDAAGLASEAAGVAAATDGLFFLPYLLGERTPWWDADASGVFAGLRMHHKRPELARAVMEGVGFALGLCRDALSDGDHELRPVNVIGGGANSDSWLQLFADAWGVPVRRLNVTTEATGLGAAITGLVGLGLVDFSLAKQVARLVAEFEPGAVSPRLRAASERFTDLYTVVAPWFGAPIAQEA